MVTSCKLSPGNIGPNFLAQDSKHWHRGHVASVPWEMGDIFPLDGLSEALWAARGPRRISSPLMGRGRGESLLALTRSPAAPCGSSAQGAPLSVHALRAHCPRGKEAQHCLPSALLMALGQPPHCSALPKVNTTV